MRTDGKREIKVINTKKGLKTISVNNILIHSKYDPIKEATNYLDYNRKIYEKKLNIVIYGLGFGYYLSELLNRVDENCKIYVFDLDSEVFDIAKSMNLMDETLKDPRVETFIGYSKKFLDKFKEKIILVDNIMILNSALKVLPDTFLEFKHLLNDFELGRIAVERFGNMMRENYELNINTEYNDISKFIEQQSTKSNQAVIIVSAGPSLELCVEELKKFRCKAKIYAVGRALKILMQNGIKPDMICIIDPQDIVYTNQLKGYEYLDIPLCFLSTANNLAVKNYQGPKYMFYNSENKGSITINTGKSVATAVLDIGIKTNTKSIVFIGQDLAYIDNKTHSGMAASYNLNLKDSKKILSVNGEMLSTTEGLLSFKRWIENTINQNPQVTFINCSKGAKILGTIEKDLSEVKDLL